MWARATQSVAGAVESSLPEQLKFCICACVCVCVSVRVRCGCQLCRLPEQLKVFSVIVCVCVCAYVSV